MFMRNRYFSFCFQFELLKGEPCYLALRQRTEKGCFVMYFIHLKHMLALFMTSLLHPAGHKMAALAVLLSCLSSFKTNIYLLLLLLLLFSYK